jgi:MFS family permease
MTNRWAILFVLFFARTTMAFQFQAVAALSPVIVESYLVTLADIGFLIGLFLGPGVIVAVLGGTLAARLGDKRIVMASLALMLVGGALMAFGGAWGWLLAGRLIAGVGGVIVNVVMTKMLVDWFATGEIGTAMGIFVSSWPAGIALALLILPGVAEDGGLRSAWLLVTGDVVVALVLFALLYRPPPAPRSAVGPAPVTRAGALPLWSLSLAGGLWALYNTALAMVFGFGPLVFSAGGLSAVTASAVTSIFIVCTGLAIPVGGYLADRTGRRDAIILSSLVSGAVLLPVVALLPVWAASAVFVVAGLAFGLAAGPLMTLPSLVLRPEARALGMGVFFAIYYGVMAVAPGLAGALSDRSGTASTALFLGAAILVVCIGLLALFRRALPKAAPDARPAA